tara:strand:+ start:380 stop:604 length:225 start_codon:yes stop_codon:yes gene_type:complete
MRIIKLTSLQDKKPIYINIDVIGHFFEVSEEIKYGRVEKAKHTRVGALTHNNGGFSVVESVDKILKLIGESRGI